MTEKQTQNQPPHLVSTNQDQSSDLSSSRPPWETCACEQTLIRLCRVTDMRVCTNQTAPSSSTVSAWANLQPKMTPPPNTKCNRCQRPTAHHARQDLRIHTVGWHSPRVQVCVHLWFCFLRAGLKPQQTLADMINTHQSASSSSSSNLWLCLSACLSVPSVPPLSYWWTHIMTAGVLRHEASYKLATHGGRYQVISYQGPTPKSAPFNETRRVKCEL